MVIFHYHYLQIIIFLSLQKIEALLQAYGGGTLPVNSKQYITFSSLNYRHDQCPIKATKEEKEVVASYM